MSHSNHFQTHSRAASVEDGPRIERSEVEPDAVELGSVGQIITQYPYPSVLTGFAFGFGFGLVVTLLLNRREPTWFERHVPESIQHFPDQLKRVPESLGAYWPESWKRS